MNVKQTAHNKTTLYCLPFALASRRTHVVVLLIDLGLPPGAGFFLEDEGERGEPVTYRP